MKYRIGTGTLIAVLLALAVGGYGVYQQRRSTAQPPLVERVVQQRAPLSGIAPVPEFLLRHRAALGLSDTQAQRIHAIAVAYRKELAPYQPHMQAAPAAFHHKIADAPHGTRPTIRQLQLAADDAQRLSATLATTRHAYWQHARAVLSAHQQTQADALVSQATLTDLQ